MPAQRGGGSEPGPRGSAAVFRPQAGVLQGAAARLCGAISVEAGRGIAQGLRLQCTTEAGKGRAGPARLFAPSLEPRAMRLQEQEPQPCPIRRGACLPTAALPSAPPADGRPPASAQPSQKLHTFKQGKEGAEKKGRKTNQDRFRAVQIGGSAGCRSNQLMQLSWRPAVDHLPGSRVAVVAVSAGLAPRRAGPRGREGAICPAPGCWCGA